jgi:hypothetical protein
VVISRFSEDHFVDESRWTLRGFWLGDGWSTSAVGVSAGVRLHRGQGWQAAAQVGGTLVPNWKLVAECAELSAEKRE